MSDPTKITNDVQMDGEAKLRVDRRPSIKLKSEPQIVVCMPIGDKHTGVVLECPKEYDGCGKRWQAPAMRVPALVPIQWALSHMNLITPLNTTISYLTEWGRLSAEARQIMTQQAIRMGAKYVLYWDDDTLPPPMGLYTLHNWMERHPEAGGISGIYTTRVEPNEPLIYTAHGEGAAWDIPMGPGAEPVPIFGAGAGFMLVRVEAIVKTQEALGPDTPIWADERTLPGHDGDGHSRRVMWGHDVRFCKLLNENGWQMYAHGQVLCSHLDIDSQTIYNVPQDAPGLLAQQRKNINTEAYWNHLYGQEGIDTWRKYEQMYTKVEEEIEDVQVAAQDKTIRVTELGAGMGVLAQRLVAHHAVQYRGFDISDVAVAALESRFLRAQQLDLRDLQPEHIQLSDVVIATEVMEHLDEHVFHHVVKTVTADPAVSKFVFTVPDNCMGPDEVPEHTALFNEALVRERVARYPEWKLRIDKADAHHLICVMER